MPVCPLCNKRIDVSKTGIRAYRCRNCGKMFCKEHFLLDKNVCLICGGYSKEEIFQLDRSKKFVSFVRRK